MSVLACDRAGCKNVMCDRFSHKHGYICNDCFKELVSRGADVDIKEFMNSEPKEIEVQNSFEKWDNEFPDYEL